MQPANQELFERLLGPISPLGAGSRDGPANSVSFAGDLQQENAGGGFTAQSRPARAPFGERASVPVFLHARALCMALCAVGGGGGTRLLAVCAPA
jgi:hypothetical protein